MQIDLLNENGHTKEIEFINTVKEIPVINERVIEKPVVIEKEKIVLVPDIKTNEFNNLILTIKSQIDSLKELIKNHISLSKVQPSFEIKEFNEILNHLKKLTSLNKLNRESLSKELNLKFKSIEDSMDKLKPEKPKEITIKDYSESLESITQILNLFLVKFNLLKDIPSSIEDLNKQVNLIRKQIKDLNVNPIVKIDTHESKIDTSKIEESLSLILLKINEPVITDSKDLDFGMQDLLSVIKKIEKLSSEIDKKYDKIEKRLESVLNANHSSFKNMLKLFPENKELNINLVDNDEIKKLLKEKDLKLEFDSIEELPDPKAYKGKFIIVRNIKVFKYFKKRNVLFYSTGINWIKS